MVAKKVIKTKAKDAIEVKTIDTLKAELVTKQFDLVEAKKGHKQGELINTCVLKSTRKDIARLNTAINALRIPTGPIKQKREDN